MYIKEKNIILEIIIDKIKKSIIIIIQKVNIYNINTEQRKILKLNNYNNTNLYKGKSFLYKRCKKVKKYRNKKLKLPRNNTEDNIVYDNI